LGGCKAREKGDCSTKIPAISPTTKQKVWYTTKNEMSRAFRKGIAKPVRRRGRETKTESKHPPAKTHRKKQGGAGEKRKKRFVKLQGSTAALKKSEKMGKGKGGVNAERKPTKKKKKREIFRKTTRVHNRGGGVSIRVPHVKKGPVFPPEKLVKRRIPNLVGPNLAARSPQTSLGEKNPVRKMQRIFMLDKSCRK